MLSTIATYIIIVKIPHKMSVHLIFPQFLIIHNFLSKIDKKHSIQISLPIHPPPPQKNQLYNTTL